MNTNFNYYLIKEQNSGNTPLLENNNIEAPGGIRFLYQAKEMPADFIANLCFYKKIKNPNMDTDCLTVDAFNVFSEKIKSVLDEYMPIKGLQFVPTIIKEDNHKFTNFYIPNIYQTFSSFDEELSDCEEIDDDDWENIKKIVLNKEVLTSIPLKDRLVYVAKEDSQFRLYHESIVDIIKSVNPIGMRFIPIQEWNPGVAFDFMR